MTKVGTLYREAMVDKIKEGVERRSSTFVVSYSGVSGSQMSDLRKDLSRAGARLYVSKNSLIQRALKNASLEALAGCVDNQTALVFSDEDSVEISKILVKFTKACEGALVQGGVLDGRVLEQADVKKLSDLPSREVLLSMLLSTIQAPLSRLAGALNGKTRDLLSILKQLSEQKGGK